MKPPTTEQFKGLEIMTCPFSKLPQRDKGGWGQGLTDKMAECRWLKPELVAQIEYADWTDANHLLPFEIHRTAR